jgi:hypothetical protein
MRQSEQPSYRVTKVTAAWHLGHPWREITLSPSFFPKRTSRVEFPYQRGLVQCSAKQIRSAKTSVVGLSEEA